jgi:hypothetical protein
MPAKILTAIKSAEQDPKAVLQELFDDMLQELMAGRLRA